MSATSRLRGLLIGAFLLVILSSFAACTFQPATIDESTSTATPEPTGTSLPAATPEPTGTSLPAATPEPIGTSLSVATATVAAFVTRQADEVNEAVADSSALWDQTTIGVCWDTPGFENEKIWVQDAVARTWMQESALEFVGWQQCEPDSDGIRITVADVADPGPHVAVLGAHLDGLEEGMVLNFTFDNWGNGENNTVDCGFPEDRRKFCIDAIAVHEFGHAIALTHEANRPDAPEWCRDMAQGTNGDWLITPFDLDSIMNYCNPVWSNAGFLSELDIQAVRLMYGENNFPIGSLLAVEGRLTFLRVHDVGTGYGPNNDFLDVEVVIQLDTYPGKSFGFQLRTDDQEYAHKGMLDLLRDAFNEDYRVRVDYVQTGLRNGEILRVLVLP